MVQSTNPYYQTAYALVTKAGSPLEDVEALGDPRLKDKRIGIVAGTPPATYLVAHGLMAKAKPYPLVVDTRVDSSAQAMMRDLASAEIDVGVLWGPMAGYYAKQANPPMRVELMLKDVGGPHLVFRIAMGVRPSDQNWKRQLNRLIAENQPDINKLLLGFGVPIIDGAGSRSPAIHRHPSRDLPAFFRRHMVCRDRRRSGTRPEPAAGAGRLSHRRIIARRRRRRSPAPASSRQPRLRHCGNPARPLSTCCPTCRVPPTCRPERSGAKRPEWTFREASGFRIPDMARSPRRPSAICATASSALPAATAPNGWLSIAVGIAGCRGTPPSASLTMGYPNVAWYPQGTEGWEAAGLPLQEAKPAPGEAE